MNTIFEFLKQPALNGIWTLIAVGIASYLLAFCWAHNGRGASTLAGHALMVLRCHASFLCLAALALGGWFLWSLGAGTTPSTCYSILTVHAAAFLGALVATFVAVRQ